MSGHLSAGPGGDARSSRTIGYRPRRALSLLLAAVVGLALGPGNGPAAVAGWTKTKSATSGSVGVALPSFLLDGATKTTHVTSFFGITTDYAQVKNTGGTALSFTGSTSLSSFGITGSLTIKSCDQAWFLGTCGLNLLTTLSTTLGDLTGLTVIPSNSPVAAGATKYLQISLSSIATGNLTLAVQPVLPVGGSNRTTG